LEKRQGLIRGLWLPGCTGWMAAFGGALQPYCTVAAIAGAVAHCAARCLWRPHGDLRIGALTPSIQSIFVEFLCRSIFHFTNSELSKPSKFLNQYKSEKNPERFMESQPG
jgi:hypothetical protein